MTMMKCLFLKTNPCNQETLNINVAKHLHDSFTEADSPIVVGSSTVELQNGYEMHLAYLLAAEAYTAIEFETFEKADEFARNFIRESNLHVEEVIQHKHSESN